MPLEQDGVKLALYFSEGDWNWPKAVDGQGSQGGSNPEMKKAQLKELLTKYGPIEYIWFDHAVGDGGLSHKDTVACCKSFQPGCFVGFNHGAQEGADIRLGEMGRPGPLSDPRGAGPYMGNAASKSYLLAEFTYPILPAREKEKIHRISGLVAEFLGPLEICFRFGLLTFPLVDNAPTVIRSGILRV